MKMVRSLYRKRERVHYDLEVLRDDLNSVNELRLREAQAAEKGEQLTDDEVAELIGLEKMVSGRAEAVADLLGNENPEYAMAIRTTATACMADVARNLMDRGELEAASHYFERAHKMTYRMAEQQKQLIGLKQQQTMKEMGGYSGKVARSIVSGDRGERESVEEEGRRDFERYTGRAQQQGHRYKVPLALFVAGVLIAFITGMPQFTGNVVGSRMSDIGGVLGLIIILIAIGWMWIKRRK